MSFISFIFSGLGWIGIAAAFAVAIALWVFGKVMPAWLGPLMVALLAAAFIGNNVSMKSQLQAEKLAHQGTKTKNAEVLAEVAQKAVEAHQKALEAARAVDAGQAELNTIIEGVVTDARHAKKDFELQLAASARTNERVRNELAHIRAVYARTCAEANAAAAAAGRGVAAGDCAVGVLADLLEVQQRLSGIYSSQATVARAKGLTCQRLYNAARAKLRELEEEAK